MIPIYVGFDQREAVAYHTFCQSVLEKSSVPVSFTPLALNTLCTYKETHTDGSNAFIYSRFLVPYLNRYEGWAIFADGDMICDADIKELWDMRDPSYAVMVVKHDYKTKHPTKYLGNKNEDYPRKNWSSVILWNCGHKDNLVLTPNYIEGASGRMLHRFEHLEDRKIGELPQEWNKLVLEQPGYAKLYHYTIGTPCFEEYAKCDKADKWYAAYDRVCQPL